MRKEIKVVKSNKGVVKSSKLIRLNINYLNFINEIKDKNLVVDNKNKDNIIKLYENIVNLRFNNIERVNKRLSRKELNNLLVNELKERKINLEEIKLIGENLISLNNKKRNYLSLEV